MGSLYRIVKFIPISIIAITLIISGCCNNNLTKDAESDQRNKIVNFTIIPYDSTHNWWNMPMQNTSISGSELLLIDSIYISGITDFNTLEQVRFDSLTKCNNENKYDFADFGLTYEYYRQYIVSLGADGNKYVYINCFCGHYKNWETEVVEVKDGGHCYFHMLINLTKKKVLFICPNGEA